jgi:hypothetical protein
VAGNIVKIRPGYKISGHGEWWNHNDTYRIRNIFMNLSFPILIETMDCSKTIGVRGDEIEIYVPPEPDNIDAIYIEMLDG